MSIQSFRFRLRFSLRTLFVVVTGGCMLLSYVVWNCRAVSERQRIVNWIEDNGGWVLGDNKYPHVGRRYDKPAVSWMRRLVGDRNVSYIVLPVTCSLDEERAIKDQFPDARFGPEHPTWREPTIRRWLRDVNSTGAD